MISNLDEPEDSFVRRHGNEWSTTDFSNVYSNAKTIAFTAMVKLTTSIEDLFKLVLMNEALEPIYTESILKGSILTTEDSSLILTPSKSSYSLVLSDSFNLTLTLNFSEINVP